VRSRKVAILIADGVDAGAAALVAALREWGAMPDLLAPTGGAVRGEDGADVPVDRVINTMASVLYDAVLIPGGKASVATLSKDGYAVHFVAEAIRVGLGGGRVAGVAGEN
jgi:catalase